MAKPDLIYFYTARFHLSTDVKLFTVFVYPIYCNYSCFTLEILSAWLLLLKFKTNFSPKFWIPNYLAPRVIGKVLWTYNSFHKHLLQQNTRTTFHLSNFCAVYLGFTVSLKLTPSISCTLSPHFQGHLGLLKFKSFHFFLWFYKHSSISLIWVLFGTSIYILWLLNFHVFAKNLLCIITQFNHNIQ